MAVIVVINPKGGVGKSTVATNLAGYLAHRCYQEPGDVLLGDVDRQGSAKFWLSLRPPKLAPIGLWEVSADELGKVPKKARHVVLDTPAGLSGKRLDAVMEKADQVIVPMQPSIFDIHATQDFLVTLSARRKHARVPLGVIANRVRENTFAAQQLSAFLASRGVGVLGQLRDTHNYLHLAAHGLTLWDVPESQVVRDREQWGPIVQALAIDD